MLGSKLATATSYLFADARDVREFGFDFSLRLDAKLGFTLPISFVPLRLGNYRLRMDFPIYVSEPAAGEKKLQWRCFCSVRFLTFKR